MVNIFSFFTSNMLKIKFAIYLNTFSFFKISPPPAPSPPKCFTSMDRSLYTVRCVWGRAGKSSTAGVFGGRAVQRALMRSVCQFLWHKYFHHCLFQATNELSAGSQNSRKSSLLSRQELVRSLLTGSDAHPEAPRARPSQHSPW